MKINNILIIEDDEIAAMLLQYLIEDVLSAQSVVVKENGESAFRYLEDLLIDPDHFPHLIFLDLNMPLISGYEFMQLYAEKFAVHFPDTKLVVLTSSMMRKDQDLSAKYPFVTGFFNKPLSEEQLQQIKQHMENT